MPTLKFFDCKSLLYFFDRFELETYVWQGDYPWDNVGLFFSIKTMAYTGPWL